MKRGGCTTFNTSIHRNFDMRWLLHLPYGCLHFQDVRRRLTTVYRTTLPRDGELAMKHNKVARHDGLPDKLFTFYRILSNYRGLKHTSISILNLFLMKYNFYQAKSVIKPPQQLQQVNSAAS
ncbi:unnamed protein product [Ceratitis capitata]|uniref:(Mediterranean fruit fly) hypothetical protein n=1 Tax=Ceratitis capitata TaxID=7213 RepID=A0A811VDG3_CERCA|nr:unnamed protein product [Ceratitis capitata]